MPATRIPSALSIALTLALPIAAPAKTRHHHAVSAPAGPLRAGSYVCQGSGAGMFPVTILPGARYRAAGAPGSYAAAGTTLRFTGGSLANNSGTMEGASGFALTLIGAGAPYTHCTRAAKK